VTFQLRLAAAVDRCLVPDLAALNRLKELTTFEPYVGDLLAAVGPVRIEAHPWWRRRRS
jgi:hypothetical protein